MNQSKSKYLQTIRCLIGWWLLWFLQNLMSSNIGNKNELCTIVTRNHWGVVLYMYHVAVVQSVDFPELLTCFFFLNLLSLRTENLNLLAVTSVRKKAYFWAKKGSSNGEDTVALCTKCDMVLQRYIQRHTPFGYININCKVCMRSEIFIFK